MNTYFQPFVRLIAGISLLMLSGCALTIPATVQMHGSASEVNNMVVVEDLGVGYDYIHLDPEDMASSSVQQRGVRPRVFAFEADPNPFHTIDIPLLDNKSPVRRNSVLGVDAETNPRFDWSDNTRFVYNARDFQNAYSTAFTAGGAAPVGAAFSASASYG